MDVLLDFFFQQARDRPSSLAVASRQEGGTRSFEELEARSRAWMERLGGDPRPLAVAVGNGTAFVEIVLAAWRLGLTAVAMDSRDDAETRLALCRRLGIARLAERDGGRVKLRSLDVAAVEPPAGTVLVKLTSGSTGEPLAACYDAESLHAGIRQIAAGMQITSADRVLMALPLSHSYGFDNGLLSLLVLGTPLILERSVFPADLLRAVAETDATVLPLVPPLVRSLSAAEWPENRLRLVICAGGVLPAASARDFLAASGLPVHNFYGSTETGGICFERRPLESAAAGTVGEPLPGVELLFDEDGRVSVLSAANLIGRLGERRPGGRRPGGRRTGVAGSGVVPVRTGDLGRLEADGRLRLTGRVADLLNIGGRKIAAVQVESALRGLDGVQEAAVIGVPDDVRGDRAVAFLVSLRWPIDLRPLPARLRPRELHRVDSLPHSERGKLDRHALRALAAELTGNRPDSTPQSGEPAPQPEESGVAEGGELVANIGAART